MKQILISVLMTAFVATTAQAQTKKTVPPPPPQAKKMVAPTYQQPATITSSAPSWGAPGFQHEVDINFSKGYLQTYKVADKSYTDLYVFGSYSHDLGQNVQAGADVGLQTLDSKTYITLAATGTYNLDANYSDSVLFKGGLGLFPIIKDGDVKNEFGLYVGAGKRFKLWDHVNYKPMLVVSKISDQDATILVQFLNISLNWN